MSLPDIPVRSLSDPHQSHIDDHNRYRNLVRQRVYSADYATLQEAFDDANAKLRPLIIEPTTHILPAPILCNHVNMLNVDARGAFFQPGVDMTTMLEMRDCSRWHWQGGWFTVPSGRIVDNVIYTYYDSLQSTGNTFNDVMIEGEYTTGIRIGKQGDTHQCDHTYLTNIECLGRGLPGQVGIHVGTGVYANCLNHRFVNLHMGAHETHVFVDQTNVSITNADFDTSVQDLKVVAQEFSIRNVRSEDAQRFMVTGGPASYAANITIEDVLWEGDAIALDGEWIQQKFAGYLKLSQVKVIGAAHSPIVRAYGAMAPLRIAIDGLSTIASAEEAFVVTPQTSIKGDYIQHDQDTVVVSITAL